MHKNMNLLMLKYKFQQKLLNLRYILIDIHKLCWFQCRIAKCGQILITDELDRSYNA